MTGGTEADRFVLLDVSDTTAVRASCDLITDFQARIDDLDVRGIDADITRTGNQVFRWQGTGSITGVGQMNMVYDAASNTTYIQGNTDFVVGTIEFMVGLTGNYLASLRVGDLML